MQHHAFDTIFSTLPELQIIDIGSNPNQVHPPIYAPLLQAKHARVTGFEPGEKAFAELAKIKSDRETYLPYAVGDGTEQIFYNCFLDVMSSLYEPNLDLLQHFHVLGEAACVISTQTIQTKRLDDMPELASCDYLQMDVQGAELQCLQHGENVVRNALVVQAETNLLPMYKNQPLFSEVEMFLRQRGFMLHRLNQLQQRVWKPLCLNTNPFAGLGQWFWGDAIFLRDIATWPSLSTEQLLKMTWLMHDLHRAYDLCLLILIARDTTHGTKDAPRYLDWIIAHAPELATRAKMPVD